jgi:hypothetical protein
MADRTLLDRWDETIRLSTELIVDGETGLPLIRHTQDVRPILEANKRQAASFDPHRARNADFVHVARIPRVVWNEWQRLGITKDQAALNAALQMREAMHLRTDDRRRL